MNRIILAFVAATFVALAGCSDHDHEDSGHGHGHDDHEEAAEYERGEHGGRVLRDGAFAVELAIFETGVPPEYRAWVTMDGEPVAPSAVDLTVRLVRLGGEDLIRFENSGDALRGDTIIYEPHSFAVEVRATYKGEIHEWAFESFEGRTLIEPAVAESFGLETESAGPATIRQHVHAYGRVTPAIDRHRSISARYEGEVKEVHVSVGDVVEKGQTLLTIESNNSLQDYTIPAPISGVVTHRMINPGEQSGSRELLRLADFSVVWIQLDVFPQDLPRVETGQPVILSDADDMQLGEGAIDFIAPSTRPDQAVEVRVVMDNAAGSLRPGQLVQGEIEIAAFDVPLAVRRSGLQSFRDFTVVYGKFGNEYEVRMLDLGRSGREYIEVLGGIEPGIPYVTTNSYLVKADIEKSGASHDH